MFMQLSLSKIAVNVFRNPALFALAVIVIFVPFLRYHLNLCYFVFAT